MQVSATGSRDMLQQMQQMQQVVFAKADANGDARLNADEFEAFGSMMPGGKGAPPGGPSGARPGPGSGPPSGLAAGGAAGGTRSGPPPGARNAEEAFGQLDTDGDGGLTLEEIQAGSPPPMSQEMMPVLLQSQEQGSGSFIDVFLQAGQSGNESDSESADAASRDAKASALIESLLASYRTGSASEEAQLRVTA